MKTTTIQNFNILALSVPIIKEFNSRNKTAIASSISTEKLKIYKYDFLKRMYDIGLRNLVLVIITDKKEIIVKDINDTFGPKLNLCTLKIILINYNNFFSLKGIEYFFIEKKAKNFETFYAFKGKSWKQICMLFISVGIDISGGSNNKKTLIIS
jgi:hypothetical protein